MIIEAVLFSEQNGKRTSASVTDTLEQLEENSNLSDDQITSQQ